MTDELAKLIARLDAHEMLLREIYLQDALENDDPHAWAEQKESQIYGLKPSSPAEDAARLQVAAFFERLKKVLP